MQETTIGVKELYTSLPKIARATSRGASFVVVKHAKPLFLINPLSTFQKKYTRHDMKRAQFKGGKTMSADIDTVLYGRAR